MRIILLFVLMVSTAHLASVGISTAHADEAFELLNGANVTSATATPAPKGGTSRIALRLENYSSADIYLLGIRSKMADSGVLMIQSAGMPAQTAKQYLVRAEETLDLATSHIWLELRGLRMPLTVGKEIRFDLIFRNGITPGLAHVHP